jgi:Glycoside hydrolase family 44
MRARWRSAAVCLSAGLVAAAGCRQPSPAAPDATPVASAASEGPQATPSGSAVTLAAASKPMEVSQYIFDGGLVNEWQDWGWAPKEIGGGPAKVRFDNWGGWILAHPDLSGSFGGVRFRVKATDPLDFLEVHLIGPGDDNLPRVVVTPELRKDGADGWSDVFVPMGDLDPDGGRFDRVVLRAVHPVSERWVLLDKIALTKPGPPPPPVAYDPASLPRVDVAVDCRAKAIPIHPEIYGIAAYPFYDAPRQAAQWTLGAGARRWGGNPTSTYNWQIDAWNSGSDYFYENMEIPSYRTFLKENADHGAQSALTVPIMGWVSKDKTSVSFPVSVYGEQEATDPWRKDAGNGKKKSGGTPLKPRAPTDVYTPADPAFVKRWIEALRKDDAASGHRSVFMYILDNEPGIWSSTHRDVHPEPVSYDELVKRTIDYGTAVRQADPDALIAGPAEWGWVNYLYSAKDMAEGGPDKRPDRRAHGDLPVVAHYLKALAEHEKTTGVRVLDVLDLHAYPYAEGVSSTSTDANVAALRMRTTRMLWDPSYVDESWVKEPVKLLPRMRQWIDQYYPGRGISIGEWNFGGENHVSGAIAIAEAFGRFAEFGVSSAFYWVYPEENSPAAWAFRAYRNYDGKGARFLDWYVPTTAVAPDKGVSFFASRDASGKHLVVVALNLSPKSAVSAGLDLSSCGKTTGSRSFVYRGPPGGIAPGAEPSRAGVAPLQALPPHSITVLDFDVAPAVAPAP